MSQGIRVAAVDDDRMLLDGLGTWLAQTGDIALTVAAATVDELLGDPRDGIDLVLLDLVLRDGSDPVDNVRRLIAADHRVLVLSVWSRPHEIAAAFAAGASGYVTKDHDLATLASVIRTAAGGETVYTPPLAMAFLEDPRPDRPRLSTREREILLAYASGMTLTTAARHVGVRPDTAKTYLDRVKAKYLERGRPTYTKLDLADRVREDGIH
ncbi:helix-turn-helix transcriptional regulator [Virgisporangium aurantiacum]|nr:response regulator [Virgisporangium aurantiacum]